MPDATVYQIKVILFDIEPPVWRRLQVAGDTSLARLHTVLQIAMGWEDGHLHEFNLVPPQRRIGAIGKIENEARHTLNGLQFAPGMSIYYTYDFGDCWEHELAVEECLERDASGCPICKEGERACPPEDCGGTRGYANILEALADPEHEDHEGSEWFGRWLDPERFDIEDVNSRLAGLGESWRKRRGRKST